MWYIKEAATDMKYFAWSKSSRKLVHKENFSLIWQVVFKIGYISFEFEWTSRKVASNNNSL